MLTGKDLKRDEDLRMKLTNLKREALSDFEVGFNAQGLQKTELRLKLMEKNRPEFSLAVRLHNPIINPFSS